MNKKKANKAETDLNKKRYKNLHEFFETPREEQEAVMKRVIEKATEDQEKLLKPEFTFDEITHRYYLDGKPLLGTTTVLGSINKPALVPWAAKMTAEHIKEVWKKNKDYTTQEINDHLKEAKNAWKGNRDSAAKKGTDIHALCEDYINATIAGEDFNTEEEQVLAFIKWATNNEVEFLGAEKRVYSETYKVAGTYDFKCIIGGKTYMGDIKTTSGIYDRTPFAQCSAYQAMETEMETGVFGEGEIVGRVIVNLKKKGGFFEGDDVYYSDDFDKDISIFLGAYNIYKNLQLDN